MERSGFSPRNNRRIVARRVRENIGEINRSRQLELCDNMRSQVELPEELLLINLQNQLQNSSSSSSNSDLISSESSSIDSSVNLQQNDLVDIQADLKQWALMHNVTGLALNDLLNILKKVHVLKFLPADYRTLLKSSIYFTTKTLGEGSYCHFGLINTLTKQIDMKSIPVDDRVLNLNLILSFDGLPISKSNNNQFWPIQAKCIESNTGVFVVGLYFGNKKPISVKLYLQDLILELKQLISGVQYKEIIIHAKVSMIIADAPARSFLKQCKNHNAYHGCEKCCDPGLWIGRVTFPTYDSPLRTDLEFKLQTDKNHHVGISPFLEVNVPLISAVPLDYMHLLCLGVVRKLLRGWVKGPLQYKVSCRSVQTMSDLLVNLKSSCPREFSRKPRSVREIDMWKATEFRSFLLYTGPVILKSILSKEKYEHFMILSVATTILISDKAQDQEWNSFADKLYRKFVKEIPKLYSREYLVYNVHSLLHISTDAMLHGPLDKFSAFEFENNMQVIKRSLRAPYKPFQQAINRVRELSNSSDVSLKHKRCISIKNTLGDGGCILNCGTVVLITRYKSNDSKFKCKKFIRQEDYFIRPCSSKLLGIFKVN